MLIRLVSAAIVVLALVGSADAQSVCSGPQWTQTSSITPTCTSTSSPTEDRTFEKRYSVWGYLVCPGGSPTETFETRVAISTGTGDCGLQEVNPGQIGCPPWFSGPQTISAGHWKETITDGQFFWAPPTGWCYDGNTRTNDQYMSIKYCDQSPCPSCKPNGMPCIDPNECCTAFCADPAYECGNPSPILIHLKNNSSNYHLTSARDGVRFDIDGDGDLDQVSWTEADSEVAFLVLDRNGNGTIDGGSELFGTETRMSNGQKAPNGFDALLDLDGGPISDGKVDSTDPHYAQLRLWLDRNHNGVSEPSELITLEETGVVTIFTTYRETSRVDKNGNAYRYFGEALLLKSGQTVPRKVFDVFLKLMPN